MGGRWRRWSMVLFLTVLGLTSGVARTVHAGSDSESIVASLGYPELALDISDSMLDVPRSIPAGRTAVAVRNTSSEPHRVTLMRVLDEGSAQATPATLAPTWSAQAIFPGFPGTVPPRTTSYAVVDLLPGQYVVGSGVILKTLTVTETKTLVATPKAADPEADATVTLFEYDFQLPASITSGDQLWKVVNAGREPHELVLVAVPDGTTRDELLDVVENGYVAGDPAGGLDMLSPGAVAWIEVDVAPGTYAAVCYVIDPSTGQPHAMEGMIEVFTVS